MDTQGGFPGCISRVEISRVIFQSRFNTVDSQAGFNRVKISKVDSMMDFQSGYFQSGFPQWISRVKISRVKISRVKIFRVKIFRVDSQGGFPG